MQETAPRPVASAGGSKSTAGSTRLQIRLLDGSSLRGSFAPTTTLAQVREWIDQSRADGDHPYTLKQLMTPAPSRKISDEDGGKTLADLELHPSATLIMSAVEGLAAAYQQSPANAAQTVMSVVWSYFVTILMRVMEMMKTFLGLNQGQQPSQSASIADSRTGDPQAEGASNASGATASSSDSGIRIRTLRDQRGTAAKGKERAASPSEHQLYNGGGVSLCFRLPSRVMTRTNSHTAEL